MSQDVREYWGQVGEERQLLVSKLVNGELPGQPPASEGFVYIVSTGTRRNNTVSGVVMAASHRLAAQRIVDETHAIASEDQITAYLENQKREAQQIRSQSLAKKAQVVMHVNENMEPISVDPEGQDTSGKKRK